MGDVNLHLGRLVVQAREERGLSPQELADLLDIDLRTLQRIENGQGNPSIELLGQLIHTLFVSPQILLKGDMTETDLELDHVYRLLLQFPEGKIKMLCDSASHVRRWMEENAPEELAALKGIGASAP